MLFRVYGYRQVSFSRVRKYLVLGSFFACLFDSARRTKTVLLTKQGLNPGILFSSTNLGNEISYTEGSYE